jgi:CBS domain-containing protein
MLKASDVMRTDFETVTPETTVEELGRLFIEKNTTGMPVLDAQGGLFGIVTENDLISQNKSIHIPTMLRIFDAFIPLEGFGGIEKEIRKMSAAVVSEICITDPIIAHEDTTLVEIATIMTEKKVHHIPVVREGGLIGMIDQHDVIRGLAGEVPDREG